MTDKKIVIDASKCEWRTGVEHYGNYECMLNKCCDYNCDWYKRRKLEQQLKHKEQSLEKIKLMLQTIIETNKIYPLQNNLLKLLDIIEGKENE